MLARRPNLARALTLFEVIISIALMSILLTALLTFFWQTLSIRDQVALRIDRTQIVKQVFDRMSAELRAAVGVDKVGFPVQVFKGDRRSITFVTAPLPAASDYAFFRESQQRLPPQQDLREITYQLWIDPDKTTESGDPLVGGILRTERRALDPSAPQDELNADTDELQFRRDLWSPELGYLEFRYFDGVQWSTTWNVPQGNPLPLLVQITVGFDSLTKADLEDQDLQTYPIDQYPFGPDLPQVNRFSEIVRVPGADQTLTAHVKRQDDAAQEVYQTQQGGQPAGENTGQSGSDGTSGGGKTP